MPCDRRSRSFTSSGWSMRESMKANVRSYPKFIEFTKACFLCHQVYKDLFESCIVRGGIRCLPARTVDLKWTLMKRLVLLGLKWIPTLLSSIAGLMITVPVGPGMIRWDHLSANDLGTKKFEKMDRLFSNSSVFWTRQWSRKNPSAKELRYPFPAWLSSRGNCPNVLAELFEQFHPFPFSIFFFFIFSCL